MFFGRDDLIEQLNTLWGKRVSSLVTCRGRRRVGKSTLIRQFALRSEARFLKIEGVRPEEGMTNANELATFASQLSAQTGCDRTPPVDWLNAFIRLSREIRDDEKTVVLLDEVSWLAFDDLEFANTLRIAWENYLKLHDRLILVVCGSVSGWIREMMIDNGSYMGRRSLDLVVKELPLRDCVRFWGDALEKWTVNDIFDILAVTGGIPRYLEEVSVSLSPRENIRRLCFLPKAVLREDFDEMFRDVITRQPRYSAQVVKSLVDGPRTVSEIAENLHVEKGGRISEALFQLEEAGFVTPDAGRNPETGAEVRERRYRLKDNYVRFYLKYIAPAKRIIDDGAFIFGGFDQFSDWDVVLGLQFENLVLNNYRDLLKALHFDKVMIESAAPYRKNGGRGRPNSGFQIDLLLQAKSAYYLVEIKKRRSRIGHEVVEEVRRKAKKLKRPEEVSLRTALVHAGEIARSVEAEGYFDAIVDARTLLGL